MKKLMVATAVAVLAGAGFAKNALTDIYDYNAKVKCVDSKVVRSASGAFIVKQVKTASLKGYFVAPTRFTHTKVQGDESGRKPGFLVLKGTQKPSIKIFPANLITKVWSPNKAACNLGSKLEAEGYLFAGLGKAAVPASASSDYFFGDTTTRGNYNLFGQANIENGDEKFVDGWLDAAGFGKAFFLQDGFDSYYYIGNLAGSLIGGMFIGPENSMAEWSMGQGWSGTTDVITGTWSLKPNTKIEAVALSSVEMYLLKNFSDEIEEMQNLKAACQAIIPNFSLFAIDDGFRDAWF